MQLFKLDLRFCSICMMCCLIMGKMILPPKPHAILSRALSPATALLVRGTNQKSMRTAPNEPTTTARGGKAKREMVQLRSSPMHCMSLMLWICVWRSRPYLSKSSSSSSSAMDHSSSSSRSTIIASIWGTEHEKNETVLTAFHTRSGFFND